MDKKDNLLDWYQNLNEEELTRITVPVLDTHPPELPQVEPDGGQEGTQVVMKKTEDPVVEKDRNTSMIAFVLTKKIQNLIMRLGELESPYADESEARQNLVDKITEMYKVLGENISKL